MARGQERKPGSGVVGPGSTYHAAIQQATAKQTAMFGTLVGTQDDGQRTAQRPAPVGGHLPVPVGAEGPGYSRPVFHGAHPNAIKLAQMNVNYDSAMAGLMQPPPSNDRKVEGLVDTGMGRLSDGVDRPVQSWKDERIIKRD